MLATGKARPIGDLTPTSSLSDLKLPKGQFWYVATPYTNYRDGLDAAYVLARDVSEMLRIADINHYVPVVPMHEALQVAGISDLPDHNFFMAIDKPWMARSHGLLVIGMDGWDESRGVTDEREYFTWAQKPMRFLEPAVMLVTQ